MSYSGAAIQIAEMFNLFIKRECDSQELKFPFPVIEMECEEEMEWESAGNAFKQIRVLSNNENELVTVEGKPEQIQCVGVGTDAAVFRLEAVPRFAFKVYSSDKLAKMEMEKRVYLKLGQSTYFPTYFGGHENFIVLSFEEGTTLYDCLLKGIQIPKQAIQDVEDARGYALNIGLNPRDIHLKNILLHEGRGKLLDVSEYEKPGNDNRWEYLKKGYEEYYHLIDGKAVPHWIVETVRKWYNHTKPENFNHEDFTRKLINLFHYK